MTILINKQKISDEEIYAEMQYHKAKTLDEAKYKASLALTIKTLLLEEARKLGIKPKAEINDLPLIDEYLVNEVLEQQVQVDIPSEADCMHYYHANQKLFTDKAGCAVEFALVKESILEYLQETRWQTESLKYIKELANNAKIINILQ